MAELSLHRDLALIGDADVDGLVDLLINRTDQLEGLLKLIVILVVFLHVLQHIPTNKYEFVYCLLYCGITVVKFYSVAVAELA